MLHERFVWTTNGFIDAMRRVRKAGVKHTLADLPSWWPRWLTLPKLSTRARKIVNHVWPSPAERAEMRSSTRMAVDQGMHEKRISDLHETAVREEAELGRPGGVIGKHPKGQYPTDADACLEAYEQTPGDAAAGLLTKADLMAIDFGHSGQAPPAGNGWSIPPIKNQVRCHRCRQPNLPAARASQQALTARSSHAQLKLRNHAATTTATVTKFYDKLDRRKLWRYNVS